MWPSWHGRGEAVTAAHASARTLSGPALAAAMRDSRALTLSRVADLSDAQWLVPRQPGVNPVAWELAHMAWFAEFWILRGPHGRDEEGFARAAIEPVHIGPDTLFDSARLPHAARWQVAWPSRDEVVKMLRRQLDACLEAIPPACDDDDALYFHRLALFHEDMHAEAFAWLRAVLNYPAPVGAALRPVTSRDAVAVQGGNVETGRPAAERGFAFDNECPARMLHLHEFEIDATPVTAGDFLRFVADGGYARSTWWPEEAGAWRATVNRSHPARWRHLGGDKGDPAHWEVRWFDQWQPLDPRLPVIHVNAWEAQAYAHWAKRRLPTSAEWEHAAPSIDWGHSVWEWTADVFLPYAGFEPGPYREYSEPWLGSHRELRGGAFATSARMHDRRYRNFFTPDRSDVFAGFRTAAS